MRSCTERGRIDGQFGRGMSGRGVWIFKKEMNL
jgi:hypothetical protein